MTLDELKTEETKMIAILQGKEGNWNDAKRFNMVVNAIRYITEMKAWANKLAAGTASRTQISMAPKPVKPPYKVLPLNAMGPQLDAALNEKSNSDPPKDAH